jgi:hypothetical protein
MRGIESGRDEVITYLELLWGVKEAPSEDPSHVRSSQNRIPADLYVTSQSPSGPEPGTGSS